MKIVFMGTPDFAAESLKRLFDEKRNIAAVFTQPDKPKNRGMKLMKSPVKELALGRTELYQPASLKESEWTEILQRINPDIILVVAYGQLLPQAILDIPKYGCVNIHGSLLPKYRGAAPIQRAVLAGDKTTGVTSMYMSKELDAGDVILKAETEIGEYETSGELFARLSSMGAELLCKTLDCIEDGTAPRIPQDHSAATFAPPLKKGDVIDWRKPASTIINEIRGLDPWPCAQGLVNDMKIKLFAGRKSERTGKPGEILDTSEGLTIACGEGAVRILELQAPGKKRMKAEDFLRGNKLEGPFKSGGDS